MRYLFIFSLLVSTYSHAAFPISPSCHEVCDNNHVCKTVCEIISSDVIKAEISMLGDSQSSCYDSCQTMCRPSCHSVCKADCRIVNGARVCEESCSTICPEVCNVTCHRVCN